MDWASLLSFSMNPLEIIARGTLVFWFLLLVFRFVLRRDIGNVGISDFLFVAIVADASQNAMSGEYRTVPDGFVLVGTLVFWNFALDFASYRWAWLRPLIDPPSLRLVYRGRFQWRNMRREQISAAEVMAKIREEGLEQLAQVKEMRLESDGAISVIKAE
jgi:uncharacterized membrane protein YcaP (DUF421 family)